MYLKVAALCLFASTMETFCVIRDRILAVAYPMAKSKAVTLEGGGTAITGEIEYISPVINAQSGTVEVRIRIPNPQHKLISGGRCSLAITPK